MEKSRTKLIEWITAVSVIASLIFVGVQIRQNTAAIRAASYQALADQGMDINLTLATHPALAAGYAQFRGDSATADQQAIRSLVMAYVRTVENAYYMGKLGTFEEAQLRRFSSNALFSTPNFARFWASNRNRFADDFRIYMDSIVGGLR